MSTVQVGQINSTDGSTAITTGADGYVSFAKTQIGGRRNLIINGAMQVAQRGTSAVTSDVSYPVDRFFILNNTSTGTFSAQQVSESPDGFKNSLKVTVTAADTDLANAERLLVNYYVEGNDFVAPAFGTSSAQNITLSFQVRSSLTGTFSGSVQNSAQNRSFPFEYTINSADTWEAKSVTITGDTTGTWLTDTGVGLRLRFSLGCGSVQKGTVNTWASANYFGTSAETPLIGTSGATFYITGVQLEVGTVATPFEHRSYGEELALCQRYCQFYDEDTFIIGAAYNSDTDWYFPFQFSPMRTFPSFVPTANMLLVSNNTNNSSVATVDQGDGQSSYRSMRLTITASTLGSQGDAGWIQCQSAESFILDAEL